METKKIIIDGEEVEVAVKLDDEYYERNYNEEKLEKTLELEIIEDSNNE